MIVVSDTSPVSNLLIINRLHLLQKLFKKIIIPNKVYNELLELEKFGFDVSSIKNTTWIEIRNPQNFKLVDELKKKLDEGESEGIVLAKELNADYLLIDEQAGREIATSLGLHIIELLGILIKAKEQKIIIQLKPMIDELIEKAGFWISKDLYEMVISSANE